MNDDEMRAMLIEYMGKGFLENIIALMRQEHDAVRFLPALLADEAIVVRLGATALVEELVKEGEGFFAAALPGLRDLLGHANPTVRGDAANVIGIIGDRAALDALLRLRDGDDNASVREIAADAVREIEDKTS